MPDSIRSARRRIAIAICSAMLILPLALLGQSEPEPEKGPEAVPLAATTQRTLVRLQEDWLRWLSASYHESGDAASVVVERLLATGNELDFQRFPDLSLGALQQAARAARDGEIDRAEWILETAEQLDTGRSETRFAEAFVARQDGGWFGAVIAEAGGYLRIFGIPRERAIWLGNVLSWALRVLLLAAGAFILVSFVAHGPQLYQDLSGLISGPLPVLALPVVVPLLLLSPLALPAGLVWLLLLWSILLWAYSSGTERAILVFAWVLTIVAPIATAAQLDHQVLASSQPARALAALTEGRLYGDLFRDLEALREDLPEDPAALQLEADLHQRIGQTQQARSLYRRVLEMEPDNAAVLVNLGVQRFRQGDFSNAIAYFERASTADTSLAEPFYNLSQAYSQTFSFDETQAAQQEARSKDEERVVEWIADGRSVIVVEGGLGRIPEIRERLEEIMKHSDRQPLRLAYGVGVLAVAILGALGWSALRRRLLPGARFGQSVPSANRWLLAIIPGAQSVDVGSGILAYLEILLPIALLLLPFSRALGCQMIWGFEPTGLLALVISTVGLTILVAWKIRTIVQEGV